MAGHNDLGNLGEQIAVKELNKKGYQILELNYRFKRDEVDIIAQKNGVIVFVEVKTRESDYMGPPEKAVTIAKQKRIIKVANQYMIAQNLELEGRFDIFGIIINKKRKEIRHIENAFTPQW